MGIAMKRKRFKDLSPAGRLWASALIAISLGLVITAERDIQRRAAAQVRGRKSIWHLLCLNALGAASYFWWGRRPTPH